MPEFLQLVQVQIYPEHLKSYPTKIDPKMIHHLIQFALRRKKTIRFKFVYLYYLPDYVMLIEQQRHENQL